MYSRWQDYKNIAFQYFQFSYILSENEHDVEFIATCNLIARKDVLVDNNIKFDDTNKYTGGDDSYFNHMIRKNNFKIRYMPSLIVYHEFDVKNWKNFIEKAFLKGKGFAHFTFNNKRIRAYIYILSFFAFPLYLLYSALFTIRLNYQKFRRNKIILVYIFLANTIHYFGLVHLFKIFVNRYTAPRLEVRCNIEKNSIITSKKENAL